MNIERVPIFGNSEPSKRLKSMLVDLQTAINQARNMLMEREQKETISIPSGDKVVDCEQVVNEVNEERERQQKQQEQQPISLDELKPDYTMEDLMLKLDIIQANLDKVLADKKQLEEKYRNNLRTKVVVSKIFREILALKGSFIYTNVLIDLSQNKYVMLEPL